MSRDKIIIVIAMQELIFTMSTVSWLTSLCNRSYNCFTTGHPFSNITI